MPGEQPSDAADVVVLVSAEAERYRIPKRIARMSSLVQMLLEDPGAWRGAAARGGATTATTTTAPARRPREWRGRPRWPQPCAARGAGCLSART